MSFTSKQPNIGGIWLQQGFFYIYARSLESETGDFLIDHMEVWLGIYFTENTAVPNMLFYKNLLKVFQNQKYN